MDCLRRGRPKFRHELYRTLGHDHPVRNHRSGILPQLGFVDDFKSQIFAIMFSNTSAYLGYRLTMNAGLQREHRVLQHDTIDSSTAFIRVFAATGSL